MILDEMCQFRTVSALSVFAAGLALLAAAPHARADSIPEPVRQSVVKIHCTIQRPDYSMPWLMEPPAQGTGSSFFIGGKRLLTNAHVVSDLRFLELQREDDPRRYPARVTFIAHDCDLAIVEVDEADFYDGMKPLRLARALPAINDEVVVLGYPMGGERLSVTRGVVSRLDYGVYAHSGIDQHLVLQVDAAINPGNSGGPVLFRERVVGLAFQGLIRGENIGYGIPLPVLQRFLDDIADGRYDGYPELGIAFMSTRNPALRRSLGLERPGGMAVSYTDPFGSAYGSIEKGDVILRLDGHDVAEDGTVVMDGDRVLFSELIERRQWGEVARFDLVRNRAGLRVDVPLSTPPDPFVFRNLYDVRPRYALRAGLVFSPLTREYLRSVRRDQDPNVRELFYYAEYAKMHGHHLEFDEFVVFTRRLPHPVNGYADGFLNGIVTKVNGRAIRALADLAAAWEQPEDGFHRIRFAGLDDTLVLSVAEAKAAEASIRARYGVPAGEYLGEAP